MNNFENELNFKFKFKNFQKKILKIKYSLKKYFKIFKKNVKFAFKIKTIKTVSKMY